MIGAMTHVTTPTPGSLLERNAGAGGSPGVFPRCRAVALACDLHRPSELFLVVHQDCGRVGGSATFPSPQAETATVDTALVMAAESATERFPQLRVRLARLDLDGPRAVINNLPGHDSPSDLDTCVPRTVRR